MQRKITSGMTVHIVDLPMPFRGELSIAPGALSWRSADLSWVPIVRDVDKAGQKIGMARIFEMSGALHAELRFNHDLPEVAAWYRNLPKSPARAKKALAPSLRLHCYQVDEKTRLVRRADALALAISTGAAVDWPIQGVPRADASTSSVGAVLDELTNYDNWS